MGFPKPLLRIGSKTFLAHTTESMLQAVNRLVIVLGAHAQRVRPAVPSDKRIVVTENPHYSRGQLSSLKAGLMVLPDDTQAVLVHLADHPTVAAETFRRVVSEYHETGKGIVIARYHGRRGHPVLFDRALFHELRLAPENEGARAVVNADPQRIAYVDVDDSGVVLDLDTREDLANAGLPRPPEA